LPVGVMRGGLGDLSGLGAALARRRGDVPPSESEDKGEASAIVPPPAAAAASLPKAQPKMQAKAQPKVSKSMFDDEEEDDELFSGASAPKKAVAGGDALRGESQTEVPAEKKKPASLFGGDDEDEDEDEDLFSGGKVRVEGGGHGCCLQITEREH